MTEGKVIDFRIDPAWISIDDVVMGGHSTSEMVVEDGVGIFRGHVSLEDGGGFASVRSRPGEYDLSSKGALVVRLRGDEKTYSFRLRTTEAFDGVSYESDFATTGDWEEKRFALSDMRPVFRGREVEGHPPLDPSKVRTFGLMIKDRQEGAFRLEVAWIGVVRE